jgi:phytoene/squalene synthetase
MTVNQNHTLPDHTVSMNACQNNMITLTKRTLPQAIHRQTQRRALNILSRIVTSNAEQQRDLDSAIKTVRLHDPAGYLPGLLLPERRMQKAYYAVRGFWIESGLRFGNSAKISKHSSPEEQLKWWKQGVDAVFAGDVSLGKDFDHPTLRLLQSLSTEVPWTKQHFDDIIDGRAKDLNVKQYETVADLTRHAEQSCGTLAELVLESGEIMPDISPACHEAARLVGIAHGVTNALRLSIPVISTTGKLIIPTELTTKYGVRSPRYLLSALGQGDKVCLRAMENAVRDIVETARDNLQKARDLREAILAEPNGNKAVSVLLPGLASETFLNRLEKSQYQLTDRNLRNVGSLEHAVCASRMTLAYFQKKF